MRKIQIVGLALFAVFAFSAIAAASAFAVSEWLVDGKPVLALTTADTEGLLTLTNLVSGFITAVEVHCEGVFNGSIGPNGEDEITELLNTAGEKINTLGEAPELALSCEVTGGIGCVLHSLAELWPDNLPWNTQIELMTTAPEWLDHLFGGGAGKEPGYEVLCFNSSGVDQEDLCEGLTSASLENLPNETPVADVTALFGPAAGSEEGACTSGNTGMIEGEGLIVALDPTELATAIS